VEKKNSIEFISKLFKKPEEIIQRDFCLYIKKHYPDVIFFSDGSGLDMNKVVAMKFSILKSSRAIPDVFICEPKGKFKGLFVELKAGREKIYTKGGKIVENEHLKEQMTLSDRLLKKGYATVFCYSTEHAIETFENYMKL
jgi:hypothetical protein